jgi:hypothetical protein
VSSWQFSIDRGEGGPSDARASGGSFACAVEDARFKKSGMPSVPPPSPMGVQREKTAHSGASVGLMRSIAGAPGNL